MFDGSADLGCSCKSGQGDGDGCDCVHGESAQDARVEEGRGFHCPRHGGPGWQSAQRVVQRDGEGGPAQLPEAGD